MEVEVMETLPPIEFQKFRDVLKPASGFESEQFRELEYASGLRDETFLRLVSKLISVDEMELRWPTSLRQAFYRVLSQISDDPADALVEIYSEPDRCPDLYALSEALSEYEVRFQEWRFHHVKLVDRVIGDRSTGTGGSSGSGYLSRTLSYRFFPELWEARNRITDRGGRYGRSEVSDSR
jgi:tryptophan 2,3-dioxygenase